MSAVQQQFLPLRKAPHRAGTRCKVPKNEPRPALVADRLRPRSRRCAVPPSKVKRYRARRPSCGMPTHFDSVRVPGLLPGITINTSPSDYRTIKQMQLYRFDGTRWAPIGGLISE